MFYMRSGRFWDEKPESERWTFAGEEGIIFPCYDVDGNLYRLRVKCDYFSKSVKGDPNVFEGREGSLYHRYSEKGEHLWYFKGKDGKEPELVFGQGVRKIKLTSKGVPLLGKASNKYKTLSSSYLVEKDGKVVNGMYKGCSGGTPYGLFLPDGKPNYTVVIGTEGEKKGMVTAAIKRCPVLENPGVGVYRQLFKSDDGPSVIDVLKERGMKVFILCYDADKEENGQVAISEKRFVKELQDHGVTVMIGNWSGKFQKGIDDILLMGCEFYPEIPK